MTLKRKTKVVFVELQLTLPNLASLLICPCYGIYHLIPIACDTCPLDLAAAESPCDLPTVMSIIRVSRTYTHIPHMSYDMK